MEDWLTLLQEETDRLKNKLDTGALNLKKSLGDMGGMLADMEVQRRRMLPAEDLEPDELARIFRNVEGDLKKARDERAGTDEFDNPLKPLRDRFDQHFDYAELGDLAFNLNVDLEKVASFNANKTDLIVNLIEYFRNRQRLDVLIKAAHALRPDIDQPFSEFVGVL